MPDIDPSFLALPARKLADAALHRAAELGAEHADFRLERIRVANFNLRDAQLDSTADTEDVGLCVRVVHEGTWGFASGFVRTADAAVRARGAGGRDGAGEPGPELRCRWSSLRNRSTPDVTWVSAYEIDPFEVGEAERIGRLTELSERLMAADGVDHVDASSRTSWRTSSTPTPPVR